MYEELIKELRMAAQDSGRDNRYLYFTLINRAADAIEELVAVCKKQEIDLVELTGELASKPRWISVEERLPICGDAVLCIGDNEINIADFVIGDKWSALPWFFVDGEHETGVTHWMPLPEPPKAEEG